MRRAAAVPVVLVAAVALAVAGCDTADFGGPADFAALEAAFADAGLEVCDESGTAARAPGAVDERVYEVSAGDCGDGDATPVVATVYGDADDRDGAIARFHSQPRPDGVLWTFGPMTVRVTGERDADVIDALTATLDAEGAR